MSRVRSPNRALAAIALLLGGLAPLVGSSFTAPARLEPDGPARARAVELARWLRERRAVQVVDLRDSTRFADFHLPTARRLAEDQLETLDLTRADTVVLYGDEAVVARAHRALADGPARVLYMVDGVGEWLAEIMNPVIAPDATAEQRAAFAPIAELSRYFGGLPRQGVRDSSGSRHLLEQTRRRGCAF